MCMINFENLKSECYNYYRKNSSRELEIISELNEKGFDTLALTWGMSRYDSLVDVFRQLRKPKRFVVMGCGIGYQCFIWNQLYPEIPCVGIDILEHRVDFGANLIQKHRIKNVKLYSGDLRDLPIRDGDLIWQNNLLFDDFIVVDYNQAVIKSLDVDIVSYQSIETFEATLLRLGMISNSKDILIHTGKEFKSMKISEMLIETTWLEKQEIYYYYRDKPCAGSFGVDHVREEFRLREEEFSCYDNILKSRTRIDSELLRRLNNKNNAKRLFSEIGFNVPETIAYLTEKTDLVPILEGIESFVAKPAHWSESVDVHIKSIGKSTNLREISERLNKRLTESDKCNWRRQKIECGIPFKDCEKGIIIENKIDVVYELKVFVVFGDPIVCDLRTGPSEIYNVDYIRKENKYLNWDREHSLITNLASVLRIDFFRIDLLYDGDKIWANELTFMPGTILPDDVTYTIEKRIRTTYLSHLENTK